LDDSLIGDVIAGLHHGEDYRSWICHARVDQIMNCLNVKLCLLFVRDGDQTWKIYNTWWEFRMETLHRSTGRISSLNDSPCFSNNDKKKNTEGI
jgi:hypothetical protein